MNCKNCGSAILPDEKTEPTSGGILCEVCLFESPVKKRVQPSVIITPNIPLNAGKIFYVGSRGRAGNIYFWQSRGRWIWEALGNGGEQDTQDKALDAARRWIRLGTAGGV